MNILNDWFTKLEDLSSLDDKIALLQSEQQQQRQQSTNAGLDSVQNENQKQLVEQQRFKLEIEALISNVDAASSVAELNVVKNSNTELIDKCGIISHINQKIELIKLKSFIAKNQELLAKIKSLSIDENDQFNKSFYYESDIDVFVKTLLKILELVDEARKDQIQANVDDLSANLFTALNEKILELKSIFIKALKRLVEESNWIEAQSTPLPNISEIINCSANLNYLQNIHIISSHFSHTNTNSKNQDSKLKTLLGSKDKSLPELWSVELLAQPIITKFIFHFYGKNLTNKLNQPELAIEYFLNYLQDPQFLRKIGVNFATVLQTSNNGLNSKIQEAVTLAGTDNAPVLVNGQQSIVIEFVKVFNKFLKIKFLNDLKSNKNSYFNPKSRLFTNLIYQLNKYDSKIYDLFYYEDNKLILEVLLNNSNWASWVELEKNHLITNFNNKFPSNSVISNLNNESAPYNEESVMSEEIFTVDFNIVKSNYLKPTKIAVNFLNLLRNLIELIISLKIPLVLKSKLLFELIFQLLDLYRQKFHFLLKNSRIVNTNSNNYLNSLINESLISFSKKNKDEQGAKKASATAAVNEEDGDILNEIKTLSKIYCSVKYIIVKLQTYNQNTEFIKIYEFLKNNLHNEDQYFNLLLRELDLNKQQLALVVNNNFNAIFQVKIDEFGHIIHEVLNTLNNFLRKSLKIYLRNYLNLTNYWNATDDNGILSENDKSSDLGDEDIDGWGFDDADLGEGDDVKGKIAEKQSTTETAIANNTNIKQVIFKQVTSFEDLINYGFVLLNNQLLKLQLTKELRNPMNILVSQLRYLKTCFGPQYLNTLGDYKIVESQLLQNLYYYFHSYIIKINKFTLHGATQLKFDYLIILQKILKLMNNSSNKNNQATEEVVNYMNYESVQEQQYLSKVLDCCNVLMITSANLNRLSYGNGGSNSAVEFNKFRNLQDFDQLRQWLKVTSLSNDEIYDLVSRIIYQ